LSRIRIRTSPSQWLITIKPRNWPLGFSHSKCNYYESCITTFRHSDQAITHNRECCRDSNQYTPYKGKPDNMTYAWSLGPYVWQQFTSKIEESVWDHLTLVHVFHMIPLRAICGWPVHYPDLHHCRYGSIVFDSATINATKFTWLHKSRMCQYLINACSTGPNQTWKHTTLHPFHSVFFTFPYLSYPVSLAWDLGKLW
jgi:hypothetical protein